jgi:hypothetical protein
LNYKMHLKNIFETGKPHLKKLVMINHDLVAFIKHELFALGRVLT